MRRRRLDTMSTAEILAEIERRTRFETFLREKHALGWSDTEIAAALAREGHTALDRRTVCDQRRRLGLPSNRMSEHCRRRVAAKTREQLRRAGLKSLAEVRVKAHRDFAVACGWPEDLLKRETDILNVLWERGPMTRLEIAEAIGWNVDRARRSKFGQRTLLGSNTSSRRPDNRGSYLANLMARGLVVRSTGREYIVRRGRGGGVHLYSLPLDIERSVAA